MNYYFSSAHIVGKYRYELRRQWSPELPTVAFIGLNPSTADAMQDDPTIRRCVGYAKAWGYGQLIMLNLFAYRATDPLAMKSADDPIGPENDETLRRVAAQAAVVVAAWGNHGSHLGRGAAVRNLVPLHYLRLTKSGQPAHPLYLPGTLTPIAWEEA